MQGFRFTVILLLGSLTLSAKGNKLLQECPGESENPVISSKGNSGAELAAVQGPVGRGSSLSPSNPISASSEVQDGSSEAWDRFRPMIFRCKAAYPITWDFSGNKPPDLSVETFVEVDNVLKPSKRCFYSTLKVLASGYTGKEGRTGNYTCKSFDGSKRTSIYRFAHDGSSVFNTRKSMDAKIFTRFGISQVFIPCVSNVPNLNATVLRIVGSDKNTSFVPLNETIDQKYDPKIGFLLKSSDPSSLVGKFVCSANYKNDTEVVEINVAAGTDFVVSPTKKSLTFRNGKISVSCRAHEPVQMRLANTNTKIQQHIQEVTFKGDFLKYGGVAEIFTHPKQDVIKGEIQCIRKSSGEVLYTWKFDTDYMCKCTWTLKPDLFKATRFFFLLDRTLRGTIRAFGLNTEGDSYYMNLPTPRGELSCTSGKSARVNMTYIPCENPVECQIKSGFLNWYDFDHRAYGMESAFSDEDGGEEGNQTTISQGYIRSGIIKCGVEDYVTTQIAIANLETLHIDSVPTTDLVRIIGPESNVFVGDKMLFTCVYEKFQIAREAKWAFQFRNGSVNFLEIDKQEDRISFDLEKFQRTSYINISSPEIKALMCFVPVWNSTLWKNSTFGLNVSDAVPVLPDSPENCPRDSNPIIILQRNASISSRRVRIAHLVSNGTIPLYNPVSEVALICRANYPVQWVYNGEELNSSKIGKVPCSAGGGERKVYEAAVRIEPLKKEATGLYSCRKTFAGHPASFVYLYAVGDGEPAFVNEGRHMQVLAKEGDKGKVRLPCQVSNPEAKPWLFLDHEDSHRIQRLELSESLSFDPKSGFEMDLALVQEPVTTFVCSMSGNASSFGVLITLRKEADGILSAERNGGGGSGSSSGMWMGTSALLLVLVILMAAGLLFLYKKFQVATSSTADVNQLGNTAGFSSYDDVRIQPDDRENIVPDGSYNRFN